MIRQLTLSHFVLVEHACIAFSPHFNIITGETGAGKTAIIEALSLCLGKRADTDLIRQGSDRAVVEGIFDISKLNHLHSLCEEAGIACEPNEELIIRREITLEGKNRAFVNCEQVPLPFLQKVGAHLIDFIGQHAILELKSSHFQRKALDTYADMQSELSQFQRAYKREKALHLRKAELQSKAAFREKQEDLLRFQLQEIEAESLSIDEDEVLFEKYARLSKQQEISEKLEEILDRLAETPSSICPQLSRLHKLAEALAKIDPALQEAFSLLQQSQLAATEAHLQFNSYFAALEQDPKILAHIENRLSRIAALKKKYGQSLKEIDAFKQNLLSQLEEFAALSDAMEKTEQELPPAKEETDQLARVLNVKRTECAKQLETLLTCHLQSLNMSKAEVHIVVEPEDRTLEGDDGVHFYLKANPGEPRALVREHSSGGEMSRLFLAIKLSLADKNQTPTLIFDEIDANVGGKTASIIGEKLHALGKIRQILCITHFPQVASKAECHFCVQKEEQAGRTLTQIRILSHREREKEFLRMLGGEQATAFSTQIESF
jgi:DNA repair protein RecN (Recombination protein N)